MSGSSPGITADSHSAPPPRGRRGRLLGRGLVTAAAALGTVAALTTPSVAASSATAYVSNPASLVNPLVGTSGAVDTFPGPDMPFGMMQWSPDTSPDRPSGGGYEYNDGKLRGFSLTHISGPGCGAEGDLPILPTVGAIGSTPDDTTASFSHATEKAQAGYYGVTLGNGVAVKLTDSVHAGIGQFNFPASTQANLLLKLSGSANQVDGTSARIVGNRTVVGTVTGGHFCNQSSDLENDYTLHFRITFDHAFTTSGTWGGTNTAAVHPGSDSVTAKAGNGTPLAKKNGSAKKPSTKTFSGATPKLKATPTTPPQAHGKSGKAGVKEQQLSKAAAVTNPSGVYLTFDTTKKQTVSAKVGISYTSAKNATANLRQEIPAWNFGTVRKANHDAWNKLLGKIQIGGGSKTAQSQFYTALYHALLHPNVFSDDNGQYMGFDGRVHTKPKGHAAYANYSGWDIYRSQVQLAAMVAPRQTSDFVTSMLDDFQQTGEMPKWSMDGGESYVMVGDPADGIIADAYAFGARDFDTTQALDAMVAEATHNNNDRPGQATLTKDGYLPYDESYPCCNFYGSVSTQLEYDSADHAIASFAKSLKDTATYTKFATRAQNWQNTFNPSTGYMQAKLKDGSWLPGFTPATSAGFVEGTSAQYTPMVPFNIKGLVVARGGDAAYNSYLDSLLSDLTNPTGTNADLSNEPSIEIPWEYDYTGEPYKTQAIVRQAQQQLYFDAPVGQFGNDDLGAMSSWYVWSELGMYPETPGASTLVLGSPVFPKAAVHLANGRTIRINAPKARPAAPYVQSLKVRGKTWNKPWVDFQKNLAKGGTLAYDLGTTADTSWGSAAKNAPPSDSTGQRPLLAGATPANGLILAPGATGSAAYKVTNVSTKTETVSWKASGTDGVTVSPSSGTLTVPASGSATAKVTVTAGSTEGAASVSFTGTAASGDQVPTAELTVPVAKVGELWPYYTNDGIESDSALGSTQFDGSGFAYSAEALAKAGYTPGGTLKVGSVSYPIADVAAGKPDNIEAAGQTIPLDLKSGTTTLGLLTAANNAPSAGATGDLTVNYTDGTSSTAHLAVSDWTLNAGSSKPASDETIAVTTPYRDGSSSTQTINTYMFSVQVPLTAGKTVASVTLPAHPSADIHVFSFGTD